MNNAGRGISRSVSELTDDDIDQMILLNVKSALYGMQAVLPHFKQRGEGHIINVSSMLGRVPFAEIRAAYAASKHALNALTANLRMELRQAHPGIHVSTVLPGIVATEFGLNALHGGFDSRKFPGAQSADEVAEIIADLIEQPRADVYTRPGSRETVAAYYAAEDMGAAEQQPPFAFSPPRKLLNGEALTCHEAIYARECPGWPASAGGAYAPGRWKNPPRRRRATAAPGWR